jgi:hypothetical protein
MMELYFHYPVRLHGEVQLYLYCKALKEVSYLVPPPGMLLQGLMQIRLLHS